MSKVALVLLAAGVLALAVGCARKTAVNAKGQTVTGTQGETLARVQDAGKDLDEIMGAPDSQIPAEVLESAKCVAVVPDMVKGGFVIGGQHGRGVATCRTANGWSAPAFFALTGGSWGAQIGAQSVDLIMLVMNDKGMQDLLSSQFKLGGEAGIAAGPVGREASANTDWKLKSEILTYSRTRGLFAGLDLSGAMIKPDADSTQAFYGQDYDFRSLLTGQVRTPSAASPFMASVRKNFSEAKAKS
jgi:lipid-binding SYLF domain-containing protein